MEVWVLTVNEGGYDSDEPSVVSLFTSQHKAVEAVREAYPDHLITKEIDLLTSSPGFETEMPDDRWMWLAMVEADVGIR